MEKAMSEQIDYERVLVDLRAKRAALDEAIAGIERVLGVSVRETVPNGEVADMAHTEVADDAFFGLSIGDAARKYLRMSKRPRSTTEICSALEGGGLHHSSKNFFATVHSVLARQERIGADIVKVKRGQWGLAEWYPGRKKMERPAKKPAEQEAPASEIKETTQA
jgi:hypothetical protein